MNMNNLRYVICDENKAPKHSYEDYKRLNEVQDEDNLGILIDEPYVIIDLDDENEFKILKQIVDDCNIKTRILKTSRGGHFWFKTSTPIKNVVHSNTPLTLNIDIKCWGKRTMEIVKRDGEWREWLRQDETVDEIPFFLLPIKSNKKLLGMGDGDGRNDALFTFIMPLINAGLNKNQVEELFNLINNYIFDEPLPISEIRAMLDSNDIFESPSILFYNGTSFKHDVFADYMIEQHNIKYYGKSMYIYDGRAYVADDDLIKARMVEVIPYLKTNNIREAFENIKYKVLRKQMTIDTRYANVINGLLDLKTHELIPHTPTVFTINKLPVKYDPDAENLAVDNMIKSICCGKQNIINLIYQMIGYVLIPDCRYQKSFILLGNGSNGKSLLLDCIRNMFGDENCSSLALEDLSDKFRAAEIVGKILNIGDDSGHSLLENTAIFKKLVTGDSMTFERKRQDPFKYRNTAKMIFAANSLPPTTDKSDGFFRRCIIVPFDATFRPGDGTYDPMLSVKVSTESAKSRLLNLALLGLEKLQENEYFDETDDSLLMVKKYKENNNNVLMWKNSTSKEFKNIAEAFAHYVSYCTLNGYRPVNIGKFNTEYEKIKVR